MLELIYLSVPVLVAVVLVAVASRRAVGRWGIVTGPSVEVGTGPFRRAETAPRRERGAPWSMRIVAGIGAVWATITLLAFVPAGAVLAILGLGELDRPYVGLSMVAVGALSISGALLSFAILAASTWIVTRSEHVRKVRSIALWSAVHHVAVLAVFANLALASGDDFGGGLLAFVLIPCAIGLGHAAALVASANKATGR